MTDWYLLIIGDSSGVLDQSACASGLAGIFKSDQILFIMFFYVGTETYQVIPGHGNPQKRGTMFGGYLFKYYCVKYQNFHQVCEKVSK